MPGSVLWGEMILFSNNWHEPRCSLTPAPHPPWRPVDEALLAGSPRSLAVSFHFSSPVSQPVRAQSCQRSLAYSFLSADTAGSPTPPPRATTSPSSCHSHTNETSFYFIHPLWKVHSFSTVRQLPDRKEEGVLSPSTLPD